MNHTNSAGSSYPGDAKNMSHGDDHETMVGADPAAIKRGHEEDVKNVSAIWSIPIAVILFIALGLVVATATFMYYANRQEDPNANPTAVERSRAGVNERVGRIGRAGQGKELGDQPRLEGMKAREGNGLVTSRPEIKGGNPPQLHNEDLRTERQPLLDRKGWVEAGKVARIPLTEAMSISLKDHLFPVQKNPVKLTGSDLGATAANAGRGVSNTPAPAVPKKDH